MKNKFLKMTFMALCLSTGSALYAMIEEDGASCSEGHVFATIPYAGMYEIRGNDPREQSSGSLTLRQEGDDLVLENFSLIPGSYYHNLMEKIINDTDEASRHGTENRRIADFVLSALTTEVISLRSLREHNGVVNYSGKTSFGELHETWTEVKDRTPLLYIRFLRQRYLGNERYELFIESPFNFEGAEVIDGTKVIPGGKGFGSAETFRLFKVGSDEHKALLRQQGLAPATSSE